MIRRVTSYDARCSRGTSRSARRSFTGLARTMTAMLEIIQFERCAGKALGPSRAENRHDTRLHRRVVRVTRRRSPPVWSLCTTNNLPRKRDGARASASDLARIHARCRGNAPADSPASSRSSSKSASITQRGYPHGPTEDEQPRPRRSRPRLHADENRTD